MKHILICHISTAEENLTFVEFFRQPLSSFLRQESVAAAGDAEYTCSIFSDIHVAYSHLSCNSLSYRGNLPFIEIHFNFSKTRNPCTTAAGAGEYLFPVKCKLPLSVFLS